jgi:hypothetical protein
MTFCRKPVLFGARSILKLESRFAFLPKFAHNFPHDSAQAKVGVLRNSM